MTPRESEIIRLFEVMMVSAARRARKLKCPVGQVESVIRAYVKACAYCPKCGGRTNGGAK